MLDHKYSRYTNSLGDQYRITEESIFMNLAFLVAMRSTCQRKQVGSVITDAKMHRVLCLGYNGQWTGGPNECDTDQPGNCGCIHAEINAMTKSVATLDGATCFVTLAPCKMCAKILINRGITRVVYANDYRDPEGIEILRLANVRVDRFDDLPTDAIVTARQL